MTKLKLGLCRAEGELKLELHKAEGELELSHVKLRVSCSCYVEMKVNWS